MCIKSLALLLMLAAAVIFVPVAPGQSVGPACDGDITVIRVSQITPKGSMAGFMKAMEAHKAWYRSHGFTKNEIYAAKVLVQDEKTKTSKYSDTEIITFHVRPPGVDKTDAAWDAFVKQYLDNSAIKVEYLVCMPKAH